MKNASRSLLTGLFSLVHVGSGKFIADGSELGSYHGHQLPTGPHHHGLFGPLEGHQGHTARGLLEAAVHLPLPLRQALVLGGGEGARGQSVGCERRRVGGPLLGGLVDQLPAGHAR